jgi:PKHD-type hydroxylase
MNEQNQMMNVNPKVWEIPRLHIPMENMACWSNGFNDQEIDQIISLGELADFQKGSVGGREVGHSDVRTEIRDTDIAWIQPNPETEWLYERMKQFIARINYDKFQFDIDQMQALQYGKYKENGHYAWHVDSGPNLPVHRKLTLVLALTDPDSYEGGELLLNFSGNPENPHVMKIRRGDLIAFPSFIPHKVAPVTSGERLTLVTWATGSKFV